jgi:hypothetical protein
VPEEVFRGSDWLPLTPAWLLSFRPADAAAGGSSLAEEMRAEAGAALDPPRRHVWHVALGTALMGGATPADARAAADASVPDTDGWLARKESARRQERLAQCVLLRCIFGPLPFRPLRPLPASLLTWNDSLVPRLAQTAYENRILPSGHLDQDRLAVLADGLEDAGCTEAELLGHLRGEGPHWRGCWAADLLSGRW